MQKAGAIIALIAGVFGVVASVPTIIIGGLGSLLGFLSTAALINLAWGSILVSFLIIILAAISLYSTGMLPGVLLCLCAILGVVFGGYLVAAFMLLALTGGVISAIGARAAVVRRRLEIQQYDGVASDTTHT